MSTVQFGPVVAETPSPSPSLASDDQVHTGVFGFLPTRTSTLHGLPASGIFFFNILEMHGGNLIRRSVSPTGSFCAHNYPLLRIQNAKTPGAAVTIVTGNRYLMFLLRFTLDSGLTAIRT